MITKTELASRVDQGFRSQIEELSALIAIPSVSSDPNAVEDVWRSAQHVRTAFEVMGFSSSIHMAPMPNGEPGRPAVIAKSPHVDGRPTVLLYAHHDVQPVGDPARWTTPPFEAHERDGRLYGRGASDDGAGIVVHLGAIGAFRGDLPVNVIVYVEGEEEVGSPSFTNFVEKYRDELAADVIVVADSGNWTTQIPAITSSLRGVSTIDVSIRVLDHGVHSGMFGGPLLDAVTLASRLIATLHDENGDVAVAGLGGNPKADVIWPEKEFRKDTSVVDSYKLAGTADLAARVWTMPAISVIGLDATSVRDSANAIIPECTFRLSLRTVPGTNTRESAQRLRQHLIRNCPFGAQISVSIEEEGPAYIADIETPAAKQLLESLADAWGTEPVATGMGGSIPFIAEFERIFPEAVVVITGVEDPSTNAHSEDESQSLLVLRNATLAEALLLARLGGELA